MPWVDVALCSIMVLSLVIGIYRGFVFEVLSLLGWLAAYMAANWLAPVVAPYLSGATASSSLNYGAAFVLSFVLSLVVWSLTARLIRLFIQATPLSLIDRFLGAVFGAGRAVLASLALVTAVGVTPVAKTPAWQTSALRPWVQLVLTELKPILPAQMFKDLPGAPVWVNK
jgi:membrane protein required for colicin V production